MEKSLQKTNRRTTRHARIRARVRGTAVRPRLAVYKSNRALYAQLIDDTAQKTVAAADTRTMSGETTTKRASALGNAIAEKAKALGVTQVVFDRGGFRYQGVIALVAEAARAGGLEF